MNLAKITHSLLHTKLGVSILALSIVALTATASAAVFVFYYGTATATVHTPDLTLVAGPDSSSCTKYPCVTATPSSTGDYATISLSFFPSVTESGPQPATYSTNLLQLQNSGSSSHTLNSIIISNIAGTTANLGSITVYYCTSQSDTPASSANCASFAITSSSGGSITPTSSTLAGGATGYFEIVAYAASSASASTSVTFQISVSWT